MRISILCEDQARMGYIDRVYQAEHGLSILVETGKRILFDTGSTGVFIRNAALLGIDLSMVDLIVLSHGHWDHANGLNELVRRGIKKPLVVHPEAFIDRHKATGEYNGVPYTKEEMEKRFDVVLSRGPYKITDHVYFLGEIPRVNGFEAQRTDFFYLRNQEMIDDFIIDDSALAIKNQNGLSVISGCSHAGICNIVEYAKKVTDESKIRAVIGGFHLIGDAAQLERTVDYFAKQRVEHIYPMHCVDLAALSRFHEQFGIRKLCAGDTIVIE
jgi:7,8-dihydropterin-6-yl-methyl-4-(beta-D-ribofuranosyl)aminobenzene 5'-phosphate synthase